MKIVLLGPPGAGKGTQAQVISEEYKIDHISTGDIFRDLIKNNKPLGNKIKKYVESGALIPDDIVIEVVVEKVKTIDLDKGFILDGFPRTVKQAEMLDEMFGKLGIAIDKVFYFDTSKDVIVSRLSQRRICRQCGATYHLTNVPSKKDNVCDLCEGELYQRADDEPDTVLKRLEVYNKQTADLVDYYKKKKILDTVNGDLCKDEAFVILKKILDDIPVNDSN